MIQKTRRVTMKEIQEDIQKGYVEVKCDNCGEFICKVPYRINNYAANCYRCFSKIEDWQEQNKVSGDDLIKELSEETDKYLDAPTHSLEDFDNLNYGPPLRSYDVKLKVISIKETEA